MRQGAGKVDLAHGRPLGRGACFFGVFPVKSRLLWAVEGPAHLATVALQGAFPQLAASDARDQFDHRGADLLMLAPAGIAEADDLHPLPLLEHSIVPPVKVNVGAGRAHEFGGRGGAAGSEKDERDQRDELFHGLRMAEVG